jgi:HlyD family secretion protein
MRHLFFLLILFFGACTTPTKKADAYGNFEADEHIISAEATGKIIELNVEEGQTVQAGQVLGRIDSTQIVLKMAQMRASIRAIAAKSPAISAQLSVYDKQKDALNTTLTNLDREKKRVDNLLKSDAATPQQLDAINDQIANARRQLDVIAEQKSASNAGLDVQKRGLLAEIAPLEQQIAQLEDQLAKCRIIASTAGTVLITYAKQGEVTTTGKPLFKTADLDKMTLRAYVTGAQLSSIHIGQAATVNIDGPDGQMLSKIGKITWIAAKSEFTPKIIQTKDERTNLVYAFDISVKNDGSLKIGMPAEVMFQ